MHLGQESIYFGNLDLPAKRPPHSLESGRQAARMDPSATPAFARRLVRGLARPTTSQSNLALGSNQTDQFGRRTNHPTPDTRPFGRLAHECFLPSRVLLDGCGFRGPCPPPP